MPKIPIPAPPVQAMHITVLHNNTFLIESEGFVKSYMDPDHVIKEVRDFVDPWTKTISPIVIPAPTNTGSE